MNYLLIATNVLVYLAVNFRPDGMELLMSHALHPDAVTASSVLSSMFLHIGFFHLVGNMLFLHIYGDNLEDKLGHVGYLLFYFLAGAVAAFFHVSTSTSPCIGASGAVAGVMGAFVILFPTAKIRVLFVFIPIVKKFEVYSWLVLTLWFGGQLFDHFSETEAGVAFAAHIGGFICGGVAIGLLVLGKLVVPEVGAKPQRFSKKVYLPPTEPEPLDVQARFSEEKKRGLPCPACLKAMHTTPLDQLALDHCFDCGGLWLDKGETESTLRRPELPYSLLNPPARNLKSVVLAQGERICCHCELSLSVVNIEGIQVEGCGQCGGLWLEKGKLGELHQRLETR